jgi:hypothetical protein
LIILKFTENPIYPQNSRFLLNLTLFAKVQIPVETAAPSATQRKKLPQPHPSSPHEVEDDVLIPAARRVPGQLFASG